VSERARDAEDMSVTACSLFEGLSLLSRTVVATFPRDRQAAVERRQRGGLRTSPSNDGQSKAVFRSQCCTCQLYVCLRAVRLSIGKRTPPESLDLVATTPLSAIAHVGVTISPLVEDAILLASVT
jgi:hypothetical protein